MPVFAIVLINLIFHLNLVLGPNELREQADFYCLMILIIALLAGLFGFIQKLSFGLIGENVTLVIR